MGVFSDTTTNGTKNEDIRLYFNPTYAEELHLKESISVIDAWDLLTKRDTTEIRSGIPDYARTYYDTKAYNAQRRPPRSPIEDINILKTNLQEAIKLNPWPTKEPWLTALKVGESLEQVTVSIYGKSSFSGSTSFEKSLYGWAHELQNQYYTPTPLDDKYKGMKDVEGYEKFTEIVDHYLGKTSKK